MAVKIKPLTEQKNNAVQDITLIPAGILKIPTNFNPVVTDQSFATITNILKERTGKINTIRSVFIDSNNYVNSEARAGTNHTLYGETPIPSILNPEQPLNILLYKYSNIKIHPLDSDVISPNIFDRRINRLFTLDAIANQDQMKDFAEAYNSSESTKIFNISNTDTYYLTGSLPYEYLITKDYSSNANLKNKNINRMFPMFESEYNYDTISSIQTNESMSNKVSITIDPKTGYGYLSDINGKYLAKVSAFTVRNVDENFKAYINVNGIEIPMRITRLSGKNHNCIFMVKFPRYLLDVDIDVYNSIRYIRFENFKDTTITFATWKTIVKYGNIAFAKNNSKQAMSRIYGDNENEYITNLNIFSTRNHHNLMRNQNISNNDIPYKQISINTYIKN